MRSQLLCETYARIRLHVYLPSAFGPSVSAQCRDACRWTPVQAARLMARLEGICVQEHIKADRQALLVLTERSDCDMRSCINTLQFLARQTNHIRVSHVRGVQIGQKDATQSAFKLWQRLLCTQVPVWHLRASIMSCCHPAMSQNPFTADCPPP